MGVSVPRSIVPYFELSLWNRLLMKLFLTKEEIEEVDRRIYLINRIRLKRHLKRTRGLRKRPAGIKK